MADFSGPEDDVPQVDVRAMLRRRRIQRSRLGRRLMKIAADSSDDEASAASGGDSDSDAAQPNPTQTTPRPRPTPPPAGGAPPIAPTPAPAPPIAPAPAQPAAPAQPPAGEPPRPIFVTLSQPAPGVAVPDAQQSAPPQNPNRPVSLTTTLVTITTTEVGQVITSTTLETVPLPSQTNPLNPLQPSPLQPNQPLFPTGGANPIPVPAEKQQGTVSAVPSSSVTDRSGGLTAGAEAGIGVGAFIFIATIITAIVFFYRRKKNAMARAPSDYPPPPPPSEKAQVPMASEQGMGPPGANFTYVNAPPVMGYNPQQQGPPDMGMNGGYPVDAKQGPDAGESFDPYDNYYAQKQDTNDMRMTGSTQMNDAPGAGPRQTFDPYDAYYGARSPVSVVRNSELQYQNMQAPQLAPLPQTTYQPNQERWAPSNSYGNMPGPNSPRI